MPRPKGPEKRNLMLRVPPELLEELDRQAEKTGFSRNAIAVSALSAELLGPTSEKPLTKKPAMAKLREIVDQAPAKLETDCTHPTRVFKGWGTVCGECNKKLL